MDKEKFDGIPCENCITKMICKNDLHRKLLESTKAHDEFQIFPSLRWSVYNKCSMVKKAIDEAEDNRKTYTIAEIVLNKLNLLGLKGIKERLHKLQRKENERLVPTIWK